MSGLEKAQKKAQAVIGTIGRAGLHAMAPNDFEYYAISFELLKSNGNVEQIFHLPVMPNGISIDGQSIVNIMKTGTATAVQFSDAFVPKNITINGTFGRKFRLLISNNSSEETKGLKQNLSNIDLKVKTGYGSMKVMESVLDKLYILDEFNLPRFLILHNYTFNQSLVVEVLSKSFTQSVENNMIWNYSIQLKGIADASKLLLGNNGKKSLKDLLLISSMQSGLNKIFSDINIKSVQKIMMG